MTALPEPPWPPQFGSRSRGRRSVISTVIGTTDAEFAVAAERVLRWGVKTASGFTVSPVEPARPGQRLTVTARVAGLRIREPIEVVEVIHTADHAGLSYRALPGHPVSGEEAFVVHRDGGRVVLTIRSVTAPATTFGWRMAFPILLIAQQIVRRRYLRSLL